jgi:mannose-6-phosphate isomerase-like protein (cupin superfamily)
MTPGQGDDATRDGLIVVPPGGGTSVRRRFGEQTVIKVRAPETGDAYAVRETVAPAGFAAPFHIHHGAEEAFYILAGTMTVMSPERTVEAPAGSFVLIPRGTVHTLANHGAAPLRWLTFISPGWVSDWIVEEGALLDAAGTGEPDAARQEAIYEKYGLELVAPPPDGPAIDGRYRSRNALT